MIGNTIYMPIINKGDLILANIGKPTSIFT